MTNLRRSDGDHHDSLAAFQHAVADGCCICKRFEKFREAHRARLGITSKSSLRMRYEFVPQAPPMFHELPINHELLMLHSHEGDDAKSAKDLTLNLVPAPSEDGARKLISSYDFDHLEAFNTGSEHCLALARHWLDRCTQNHTTCDRPPPEVSHPWKPSRLVYVSTSGGSDLRLCVGGDIPTDVRYTTLSHCWGVGLERKSLTRSNIDAWRECIPDGALMKTFRDAIKITRSLGIDYIWIDSLCIVQDSEADWLQESSLMSKVYKYTYCNIAATAADSDDSGAFFDRKPGIDHPVGFNLAKSDSASWKQKAITIWRRTPRKNVLEEQYNIQRLEPWADEIDCAPLNERAWVVQEVVYAKCILNQELIMVVALVVPSSLEFCRDSIVLGV